MPLTGAERTRRYRKRADKGDVCLRGFTLRHAVVEYLIASGAISEADALDNDKLRLVAEAALTRIASKSLNEKIVTSSLTQSLSSLRVSAHEGR